MSDLDKESCRTALINAQCLCSHACDVDIHANFARFSSFISASNLLILRVNTLHLFLAFLTSIEQCASLRWLHVASSASKPDIFIVT